MNMEISTSQFEAISSLIYRRFGINLTEHKKGLVSGRLKKILRELNMESFDEYIEHLSESRNPEDFSDLIDRISTNHTFFFREKEHFDFFVKSSLPEIRARLHEGGSGRDLRVWCAGCSSGTACSSPASAWRPASAPRSC